jgi:hypothetical protein
MQLDLSGDPLVVWDNTEEVRVTASVSEVYPLRPEITVRKALRAQPTAKERAPTNGVYVGYDLEWCLPGALLSGYRLKPGDRIKDQFGDTWTALTANFDQLDRVWQCHCVNLVLVYALRDTLDIQRAHVTRDVAGGVVRAWPDHNVTGVAAGGTTPYAAVQASVQLLTQQQRDERGMRGQEGVYSVVIGEQVLLTAEDRVKATLTDGTILYLLVKGQHNPTRLDELPVLDCVRSI